MKKEILFLSPYFEQKIWGGQKLKKYGFNLPSKNVGEAWIISAYPNKSSLITNGDFKGKTLYEVFLKNKKELFHNYQSDKYPLLVKLLDCNDDLSVQVHPKDKYALKNYNELGKNECWYILSARKNADIIYGHNAKTKKQLIEMINKNQWNKLLKKKKVKKDSFIYVPAGTIHAINGGLLIYELQQSSDITFRLYDYDRQKKDPSRKLHTQESILNIDVPFKNPKYISNNKYLIKNKYFTLEKINNKLTKTYEFRKSLWLQCSVIEGKGKLNDQHLIKKGDSFLICNDQKMKLSGSVQVLVSYLEK